jgi:hypothetical protein
MRHASHHNPSFMTGRTSRSNSVEATPPPHLPVSTFLCSPPPQDLEQPRLRSQEAISSLYARCPHDQTRKLTAVNWKPNNALTTPPPPSPALPVCPCSPRSFDDVEMHFEDNDEHQQKLKHQKIDAGAACPVPPPAKDAPGDGPSDDPNR